MGGRLLRNRSVGSVRREMISVLRSLRGLERSLSRLLTQIGRTGPDRNGVPSKEPRRKLTLSPARLKALRLHGRYLGYMRQLKPKAKAEVKALREKKGVEAAIAKARRLARG
jgi:hypothetical protein